MRLMTVTARLTSSYYSRGCHRVAAVNQSSKSRWVFCVDCLDWGVGWSYGETKSLHLSLSGAQIDVYMPAGARRRESEPTLQGGK